MQDWLTTFSAALAQETPALPAALAPSSELAEGLLALARMVADGTGQKTNAPLTCYMVGHYARFLAEQGGTPEEAVTRATEIAGRILNPQG